MGTNHARLGRGRGMGLGREGCEMGGRFGRGFRDNREGLNGKTWVRKVRQDGTGNEMG